MATYKEIQEYVFERNAWRPKTCWIADAKEKCGIKVKPAYNRRDESRVNPCPAHKLAAIKEAFVHFSMI